MYKRDPKLSALLFNEHINNQNLKGLINLMTDDHVFIDILGKVHDREHMVTEGWQNFFDSFPDYRNIFTRVENQDNLVILIGFSVCSYDPLDGPAIWTATIRNDLLTKWQIFEDTKENREMLCII